MHCDQDGAESGTCGHDTPEGSTRRHTVMHHQNIASMNSMGINLAQSTTKAESGVSGIDDSLPRQPSSWPRMPDTDKLEARRMTDLSEEGCGEIGRKLAHESRCEPRGSRISQLSQSSLRASSAGEASGAQPDSRPLSNSPASPILNPSTSSDFHAVHNQQVDNVSASFMVLVDNHSRNASGLTATSGMGRNSSVISSSSLSRFYQVHPLAAMCGVRSESFEGVHKSACRLRLFWVCVMRVNAVPIALRLLLQRDMRKVHTIAAVCCCVCACGANVRGTEISTCGHCVRVTANVGTIRGYFQMVRLPSLLREHLKKCSRKLTEIVSQTEALSSYDEKWWTTKCANRFVFLFRNVHILWWVRADACLQELRGMHRPHVGVSLLHISPISSPEQVVRSWQSSYSCV